MRKTALVLSAAAMLLGACSGGEDRKEADANAAAANHSVAERHGAGLDPFTAGDREMHEKMTAAVGVNVADTWVRKMIAHHEGAVDMSRVVLGLNPTAEVRRLAETTIDRQGREIEELRGMIRQGAPDPSSAEPYRQIDNAMHKEMMAASGTDPNALWIAKMIAHHRGAVEMSELVLTRDPPADVRRMAEATIVDQSREITELEALLRQGGPRT